MGTFKSQPDHYDVIKNIDDPIVTWDSLTNYEGSIRTRLDLKTDKTETEALTSRVAKDEGDIDNLEKTKEDKTVVNALTSRVSNVEATKADKTDLEKTNRNLEEVNNKASHNATDIANLHDDIEGVRGQYTTLSSSLSTLQTKYGELNAYSGKVDVLQGDISDLWDQVNAGGIGGGGSSGGGGGGTEPSAGDYYTKTESNSRFALKTSLNSYLTKSEAERTYAQNSELDALRKQIEDLEEQLQPIGTIHVNISATKVDGLSKGSIAIRNYFDTEQTEEGGYSSQRVQTLTNSETTFTNLRKGKFERNRWRVGYQKAWTASPDHVASLSSTANFTISADTAEFTELPYAYIKVTNNSGIDFDYYTYGTSPKSTPKKGQGYTDGETGEWVNYTFGNGKSKSLTMKNSTYFEKDLYVIAVNNTDQNKYWRSPPVTLEMGTYRELTITKGELDDWTAGDPEPAEGPEIMADAQSDVAALQEQLESLRAQLNGLLEAQRQVEPTGGEGPSI